MSKRRSAFFVSDRTGITAENLGRSLLSQFDGIDFEKTTLPFLDSIEKAHETVALINTTATKDGQRPIVFSTLILPDVREVIEQSDALILDLFEMFIQPLEKELGQESTNEIGLSHAAGTNYSARMDAVNYALNHDDGGISKELHKAEVVLVGVSRCGKTPTSLYLAMQFGIFAANYPLVPEDFTDHTLPSALKPLQKKIFGLTIQAERLQQIRSERTPNSRYASLDNCRYEIQQAENLLQQAGVKCLDITSMSIEEIATTILHKTELRR